MVVGKPDFELNSFGIQYKEKKVSYTNKKAGINVLSNNQTDLEHAAESKISNIAAASAKKNPKKKLTHSNQPTTRNATAAEQTAGKKFESKDPLEATSTTPSSITPKDGVFDNVPQTKEDMITQEGGSSHKKKEPAMPRTKLHGRAHQEAQAQLRESKQSPVLPKNAASEIILKMNIMKLDLMKKAPRRGSAAWKKEQADSPEFQNAVVSETQRKARARSGKGGKWSGGMDDWTEHQDEENPMTREFYSGHDSGSEETRGKFENSIGNSAQSGLDIMQAGKKVKKSASETIFKATSLKLDLMKYGIQGGGKNTPETLGSHGDDSTSSQDRAETRIADYMDDYKGDDEPTGTTLDKLQEVDGDGKAAYLNAPNMTKKQPIKPKIASAASETIFKAISLKLDLAKTLASNAGSTLVAAGTKKGKPNHIGNNGVRTQDGQHTVRGKGVGTPEQVTIDGVKTTQPRKVAVKPKGNKKTSLQGDMHMSDGLNNASTGEIKESFNMITESPKWKEEINRDAPLTEKEGTEKFDNADPTTQNILARQAKRDAAKKKRGEIVNHAISEINVMTDGMKELMKRDGEKIGMGEKDTRQMQDRFNEDHLSDFPEIKGTKQGKEVERHMNEHMQPIDNP